MNKSKVQRSGREAIEFHYDDDIRTKKLYMLHKISLGHCPDYFASYIKYLKDTRASKRNTVLLPSYQGSNFIAAIAAIALEGEQNAVDHCGNDGNFLPYSAIFILFTVHYNFDT